MSGSPLDAGQVERISTVRKSKGWNRVNPRFLHQWDFFSNVENSIICSDAYQRQDLISSKESLVATGKREISFRPVHRSNNIINNNWKFYNYRSKIPFRVGIPVYKLHIGNKSQTTNRPFQR